MKIVVDDKIPFIREAISQISTDVIYKPGIAISPDDIHDADALIIRTRTRCDEALLKGSKVSFIATATIGYDHLDIEYSYHMDQLSRLQCQLRRAIYPFMPFALGKRKRIRPIEDYGRISRSRTCGPCRYRSYTPFGGTNPPQ